jgi:hypothetical protein
VTSHFEAPSDYFLNTLSDYRGIMTQNEDQAKDIWITAFGWGSAEGNPPPSADDTYLTHTSLDEQAVYTARAYEIAAQLGFVGPMFVRDLNDCLVNAQSCYFSLIGADGVPRPVYDMLELLFKPAA